MTLRYDNYGRPRGLDWTVCNDGNPQPLVWKTIWTSKSHKNGRTRPDVLNPGSGRGTNSWIGAEADAKIATMYTDELKTAYQIARIMEVTVQTVYRSLKRSEITPRTKSEAMYLRHAQRRAS